MKIAVIAPLVTPISDPQKGGSQALVSDLLRGLSDNDVDVTAIVSSGSQIQGVDTITIEVEPSAARAALYRHDVGSDPEAMAATFDEVQSVLRGSAYDLVHNHAFDPPAVRALSKLDVPTVHTLHLPPTQAMSAVVRSTDPSTTHFVTVSSHQQRLWSEHVQSTVIFNGVPIEDIPFRTDKADHLLFVGRLTPEKGAAEAIEIARIAGLPLRLIGQPYEAEYGRVIEDAAKRADVTFLGELSRTEVWSEMAAARALLMPIRWDEPFGLVAAEALAAGTAVIGFRRGALPEIVLDGVTGVLVEEGDLTSAAAAASSFEASADKCRSHCASNFGIGKMIEAYTSLYRRVIQGDQR